MKKCVKAIIIGTGVIVASVSALAIVGNIIAAKKAKDEDFEDDDDSLECCFYCDSEFCPYYCNDDDDTPEQYDGDIEYYEGDDVEC